MADRKRRGSDPADENFDDEVLDDAVDEDVEDDEPVSRGGTATKSRAKELAEPADEKARTKKDTTRVGLFGRIGRFFREVVAELRKVIWPSRKDLLTYASVVIVFIAVMMTLVAVLDLVFAKGVLFVFGNPK
ncbi:preprotein translocase subunit SecE [Rhizomonospora bruguierae]|uniref:preprotein translocase subunit SecE n=1 Tax=Rhizomonospora bruguierae TaxID=1581705 RepID=UPI001BCE15AB|nr:preprotein translocase subunit SecE [Micromonospora sp. NBRC 107566]